MRAGRRSRGYAKVFPFILEARIPYLDLPNSLMISNIMIFACCPLSLSHSNVKCMYGSRLLDQPG